jgi:Mn-dependent DtxR family transcriptional regulator
LIRRSNKGAMTEIQARVLINLYHFGEPIGLTALSRSLTLAKSSVSRTIDWCEANRHIHRTEDRKIALTVRGRRMAAEMDSRRTFASVWLSSMGVDAVCAERDALAFAIGFPDSAIEALQRLHEIEKLRQTFTGRRTIGGRELCSKLPNGNYAVPFSIYRNNEGKQGALDLSMAMDGLANPAEFTVQGGVGTVRLRAKTVEHVSALGNLKKQGELSTLSFKDGRRFTAAGREGSLFYFPADAMTFLNVGGRFFQGSVTLRMSCTAGEAHMPSSEAIFSMFFY